MMHSCCRCGKIEKSKKGLYPENWRIIGWNISLNEPYLKCEGCFTIDPGYLSCRREPLTTNKSTIIETKKEEKISYREI